MLQMPLFLRALAAFLALPGIVAGLVPALIRHVESGRDQGYRAGWYLLTIGLLVLLACVREFYTAGKGTLAPWSPPRHLVTSGLYRYSRNPMYLGVLLILSGWAIGAASMGLAAYAGALGLAFQLRILYYEEPVLQRLFGEAWLAYRQTTRRWL